MNTDAHRLLPSSCRLAFLLHFCLAVYLGAVVMLGLVFPGTFLPRGNESLAEKSFDLVMYCGIPVLLAGFAIYCSFRSKARDSLLVVLGSLLSLLVLSIGAHILISLATGAANVTTAVSWFFRVLIGSYILLGMCAYVVRWKT